MPEVTKIKTKGLKVTLNFKKIEEVGGNENRNDHDKIAEPLTRKLKSMLTKDMPFVVRGPQNIHKDLQRTECSLLLNADGENST